MLNTITVMGRLTRDVEVRRTPNGTSIAHFAVAVQRDRMMANGERETDFIDVDAWARLAEICSENLKKGDLCIVHGRLEIHTFTKKSSGDRHREACISAENVYFIRTPRGAGAWGERTTPVGSDFPELPEDEDEDDLPFNDTEPAPLFDL